MRLQGIIGGLCCPDCAPRSGSAVPQGLGDIVIYQGKAYERSVLCTPKSGSFYNYTPPAECYTQTAPSPAPAPSPTPTPPPAVVAPSPTPTAHYIPPSPTPTPAPAPIPQTWVGSASGTSPQVFTDDTAPAPVAQQKIETVFSPIATGAAPAVIAPSSDSGSAGGAAPNISLDVAPPQVESSVPWGWIAALAAGAFVLSNNSRSSNRGQHRRKS